MNIFKPVILSGAVVLLSLCPIGYFAFGQTTGGTDSGKGYPIPPPMKPEMTESWTPQPAIVTPGPEDAPGAAPSDAIILLGNGGLSEWSHKNGEPVQWDMENGILTVRPRTGDIYTVREFGDCQLHLEWRSPAGVKGTGQGRGNSGVFLQELYEVQILDNYGNETYANGQAGSIYKQSPPLVNPIRKPGEWNTYDIIFTTPRFRKDGTVHTHGRLTLIFNGVIVQNNTTIQGTTEYIGLPKAVPHGDGPVRLQDHGDLVSFRNIWIREL